MKKNRQKRPSFLYAVIIFLALVILALGALTLYSLQDLIDLRSKVSGLQTTVQELSDASADLVKQAQELAGLNDQLSNATPTLILPVPLVTHRGKAHFHHHMMHLLSLILRMKVWITCFLSLNHCFHRMTAHGLYMYVIL